MTPKERALAEIYASEVAAQQRWRHWKGDTYTVVSLGLLEATMDAMVICSDSVGVTWVWPLFVFLEEHSPGVRRFTKIEEPPARDSQPRVGRFI